MPKVSLVTLALVLVVGCGDGGGGSDGGSTGSDSGTETDGGGGDVDGGGTPDCATYCASIEASCTGANDQFSSLENCMDTCAAFPVGTSADVSGNTLGCRTYHSGAAVGDPATHCPHAGPFGDGACGTPCESFCTLAVELCPDAYASLDACNTACAGFTEGDYSTAATGGDTLACRLYHLTVAATDPTGHCGHVGADSPTCAP